MREIVYDLPETMFIILDNCYPFYSKLSFTDLVLDLLLLEDPKSIYDAEHETIVAVCTEKRGDI